MRTCRGCQAVSVIEMRRIRSSNAFPRRGKPRAHACSVPAGTSRLRAWRFASMVQGLFVVPGSDEPFQNTSIVMVHARLPSALVGTVRRASNRTAWRQACSYHSHEFATPPPFPPAESAILSAAITRVPHYGFTAEALRMGARDAGYLDVSTNLLPRGVYDLINYHLVSQRLALKETVQFPDESDAANKLGLGAKVRALTLARLRANKPFIHRWSEVSLIQSQFHWTKLTYAGARRYGAAFLRRPFNR